MTPRANRRPWGATPGVTGWWTATATSDSLVTPDGTADLMWSPGRMPWIACPDTGPSGSDLQPGDTVIGLQLAAGAVVALTGHTATDLVNQRLPAGHVTSTSRADQLFNALQQQPTGCAPGLLGAWVSERLGPDWQPDPEVIAEIARHRSGVNSPPSELSPRQLRRRFAHAVGYGPKFFNRVCRFDRFVGMATANPKRPLAIAAADAGFCDQSHLIRDCRELTGCTPREFVHTKTNSSA